MSDHDQLVLDLLKVLNLPIDAYDEIYSEIIAEDSPGVQLDIIHLEASGELSKWSDQPTKPPF